MDEHSPLDAPEGDWWDHDVNRRETVWLGITGAWAMTLFGWMIGWTQVGDQNQMGPTYEVGTEQYRSAVEAYTERAATTTVDGEELLVPPGRDVYVGAFQWGWDGLPALLQPGETYRFHLGAYDVQHGFSVRHARNLSQQISLQVLPGYEWVVEMAFDDPGTYHVVCNEFCGTGHRSMHGRFLVREHEPIEGGGDAGDGTTPQGDFGAWFTDATGGATGNYGGSPVDRTGRDAVTVAVGAEGNGGSFAFDPPAVTVSPGTTVTFDWVSDRHNVLVDSQPEAADWTGHEAIEDEGYSFEHTFDAEGVYRYYCEPHLPLGMKGVVEVA